MTRRRALRTSLLLMLLIGLALPPGALAQWAVSSNDNKVVLVNGAATDRAATRRPDTVTIIDLRRRPAEGGRGDPRARRAWWARR